MSSSRARSLRVGDAGQFQRHRHVLQRGHGRDQVERLEHDADMAAAEARQRVLVERAQVLAGDRHRAGVGPLQPGHHHQQRRFARAGRPDQADCLAAAYIQVDVLEDMDAGRPLPEREIDAGKSAIAPAGRLGGAFMGFSPFTTPLIWGQTRPGPAPCGVGCWSRLVCALAPAAGAPTSGRSISSCWAIR